LLRTSSQHSHNHSYEVFVRKVYPSLLSRVSLPEGIGEFLELNIDEDKAVQSEGGGGLGRGGVAGVGGGGSCPVLGDHYADRGGGDVEALGAQYVLQLMLGNAATLVGIGPLECLRPLVDEGEELRELGHVDVA